MYEYDSPDICIICTVMNSILKVIIVSLVSSRGFHLHREISIYSKCEKRSVIRPTFLQISVLKR